MIRIPLILLVFLLTFPAAAEPPDEKELLGEELFAKYQTAVLSQKDALNNVDMDVLMEGKIPKLKKEGKMSAMKSISALGGVTWKLLGFWGDDTVKKEVMARYMSAEQEASSGKPKGKNGDISITPDNYKFKYKGLNERNSRQVHIFELKPKHKRVGLFKGELWLDPETCLPVRETGRLVKNPSLFIKKMEFTRDYEIRDGVAYLVQMESRTETRIVGRADLSIKYANFHKQESEIKAVEDSAEGTGDGTVEEARGAYLR